MDLKKLLAVYGQIVKKERGNAVHVYGKHYTTLKRLRDTYHIPLSTIVNEALCEYFKNFDMSGIPDTSAKDSAKPRPPDAMKKKKKVLGGYTCS